MRFQENRNLHKVISILWAICVLGLMGLLAKYALNKDIIESNLFSLLPKTDVKPEIAKMDHLYQAEFERKIIYLFVTDDRSKSIQAAKVMKDALVKDPDIEVLNYFEKEHDAGIFLEKHPFFVTDRDLEPFKTTDNLKGELWNRWTGLGGNKISLEDPLGIGDEIFRDHLPKISGNLMQVDGFTVIERQGLFATPIILNLRSSVFQMSVQERLYDRFVQYEKEMVSTVGKIEILKSGTFFHTLKAATRSKREIGMMSSLSLLGVLLLIISIFKSLKPFLMTTLVAVFASIVATSVCVYCFGKIHLLTLVFGTSLIGISDDYSLHYFCQRYGDDKWSPWRAISDIFPALSMGLLTTLLGFVGLLLTPFPALQQIAVFCCVGLVASYLCVLFFYPYANKKWETPPSATPIVWAKAYLNFWDHLRHRSIYIGLSLLIMLGGALKMKSVDDLRTFQSPNPEQLEMDKAVRNWIGIDLSSQYVVVTGKDDQELLEHQESLRASLESLIKDKKLSSYEMVADKVPSIKSQQQSLSRYTEFLQSNLQVLRKVFSDAGFPSNTTENYFHHVSKLNGKWIKIQDVSLRDDAAPLQMDQKKIGVVRLFGLRDSQAAALRLQQPNSHYVDRIDEISKILRQYRISTLWFVFFSLIIIGCLVGYRYGYNDVLKILGPPLVAAVAAVTVQGYWREGYTLFHVLAILLVLTLGVDFTLFMRESGTKAISTMAAVSMSVITTLLSFGLLCFSSSSMIRDFGLTILLGSVFSVLLSPYARNKKAIVMLLIITCGFMGCSKPKNLHMMKDLPQALWSKKPLSVVDVSHGKEIIIDQSMNIRSNVQSGWIQVRLEFDNDQMRVVGMSSIGQVLFEIFYKDKIISTHGNLQGLSFEDILRDIEWTFWPVDSLRTAFPDIVIREDQSPSRVRFYSWKGKQTEQIEYSDENVFAKKITLKNFIYKYEIQMENKRVLQ